MPELARHGSDFDVASLPRTVELAGGLIGFPALVDEGDAVGIRVCETASEQAVHDGPRDPAGLLALTVPSPRRWVADQLGPRVTLDVGRRAARQPRGRDRRRHERGA